MTTPLAPPRHTFRFALALVLILCLTTATLWPVQQSHGSDYTFVASDQLDYLYIPTQERDQRLTLDGFTNELSLKGTFDVSDHISAEVKVCVGCHGFELAAAFMDFRIGESVNIRAGRFSPAFGEFPDRYDPANHRTSDKPLPYDMGRMLRLREWNMSILPVPYVDNGVELSVRQAIGDTFEIDYRAYAVGGLRANNDALDLDFIQSRSRNLYYVDNNSSPAVGGRIEMAYYPTADITLSLGGSAMYGTYDPNNELDMLIVGGDLVFRYDNWTLRGEYLLRRTQMSLGDDPFSRFRYAPNSQGEFDDFFIKDGFYIETDFPIYGPIEAVARFDGLQRRGNVSASSALRSHSAILRYTLGANYVFQRVWRIKLSGEFYDFSDFDDEVALHLGVVGVF